MTASAIRWAVLDSLHHATGVKSPKWDDAVLEKKLSAFEYVVDQHYRYYQLLILYLTPVRKFGIC